ncbi:hypothetical protein HCN44_009909 [Aphidius gifuensis]|uniref:Myb/SANT-like DNA-binding domain-containing protein n=1 Tax=Aphidius gifuensis TaxID=684658 RepID=A0A834XYS7_APHGI|nr:hypothetical protein HCN44_009909 [Aphidius gifuensis]
MIHGNQAYFWNKISKSLEVYYITDEIQKLFNFTFNGKTNPPSTLPSASAYLRNTSTSCLPNANISTRVLSSTIKPGTSTCVNFSSSSDNTNYPLFNEIENENGDFSDFPSTSQTSTRVSYQAKRKHNIQQVGENNCNLNNVRAVWSRNSSLNLIYWYKENIPNFHSTKIRNASVWQSISHSMRNDGFFYTPAQCQRHFFELKSKYVEQNDNMSSKSSGTAPINFEFFEEFKDIFHNKPNINPIHKASSLYGATALLHPNK